MVPQAMGATASATLPGSAAADGQAAANVNARPLNAACFLVAEIMRMPQAFA